MATHDARRRRHRARGRPEPAGPVRRRRHRARLRLPRHRRDPAVPGQRHRQLRLRRHRVARRGARGQDGASTGTGRTCPRSLVGVAASAAVSVRDRDDGRAPAVRLGAHHPVRRHHRRGPAGDRAGDQRAPRRGRSAPRSRRRSSGTWQLGGDITVHAPQVVALVAIPLVALGARLVPQPDHLGHRHHRHRGQPRRQPPGRAEHRGRCRRSCGCWPVRSPGITTVLAAPLRSTPVANLAQASGIQLLVIALAVALLARMRSMLVAVVAGVVVGIVERVVFYNWAEPVRAHGVRAVRHRAGRGAARPPGRGRRRRRRLVAVEPGGAAARPAAVARARAPAAVGAGRARPRRRGRRPARDRHQRQVLPLLPHGADRDRRRVGDDPHRVGGAALARPVRARRAWAP